MSWRALWGFALSLSSWCCDWNAMFAMSTDSGNGPMYTLHLSGVNLIGWGFLWATLFYVIWIWTKMSQEIGGRQRHLLFSSRRGSWTTCLRNGCLHHCLVFLHNHGQTTYSVCFSVSTSVTVETIKVTSFLGCCEEWVNKWKVKWK